MSYKVTLDYLTPNPYSRPQTKLKGIRGIVIHWVNNPLTSAKANRNYFENRKFGKTNYGSAHEIIDLDGDIIKCLPPDEMGYHVGSKTYTKEALNKLGSYPNSTTYGIECTHIDWNGKMTNDTYNSLVERCVYLCKLWNLNPIEDLWLHKEVVGWKPCHKWFVDNPKEWVKFKRLVKDKMDLKEVKSTSTKEGSEMYKPNNGAMVDATVNMLKDFADERHEKPISSIWADKAAKGEITESEAIGLLYVALERKLIDSVSCCGNK